MTMSLAERLIHARTESGYQEPAEVAHKINISPSAIYQLEDGTTKSLRGTTAVKLGRAYPRFRVEWLIDGSGAREHTTARVEDSPALAYSVAHSATEPGYVRMHVMEGDASGGDGALNEDYPEVVRSIDMAEWQLRQQIGFIPDEGRVKLITVRGDSMYPDIKNGDVVMVDTARNYYSGDGIYLINVNNYTFVKRLQMLTNGLNVLSTNPKYMSQVIPADEMDTVHVGGKIVGLALMRRAEEV